MALLGGTLWGCPSSVGHVPGRGLLLCLWLGSEQGNNFETSLDAFRVCPTQLQERLKSDSLEPSEMRERTEGAGQAARRSILPGSGTGRVQGHPPQPAGPEGSVW